MLCASWCQWDAIGCELTPCGECFMCGGALTSTKPVLEAREAREAHDTPEVVPRSRALEEEGVEDGPEPASLPCQSWCTYHLNNCGREMCLGCDMCQPEPEEIPTALRVEEVKQEGVHEDEVPEDDEADDGIDLSEWPCANWCRYDAKNCGREVCHGCPGCDLRPRHCLTWGVSHTQLGHGGEYYCTTDAEAGDWCGSFSRASQSPMDPTSFSLWILVGHGCCVDGKLLAKPGSGCPHQQPQPPLPPGSPPPPPSPSPPPPPQPLPPAPSPLPPPPTEGLPVGRYAVPFQPPQPPLNPQPPHVPPAPPSQPPYPDWPLIGGALPPTAPTVVSPGAGNLTLWLGAGVVAIMAARCLCTLVQLRLASLRSYRGRVVSPSRGRHLRLPTVEEENEEEEDITVMCR